MELRYPILIVISIISIVLFLMFSKKKQSEFTNGSKIANTEYLKQNEYYKKKLQEYNLIKRIMYCLFASSLIASIILIARLSKVDTLNNEMYNRDIFLCMDVSASVDELNMELVESLKSTVAKLDGERFGISIFNTSSVVLVPLTDDYEYVMRVLDEIKKSIEANNTIFYDADDYFYTRNYITSGTLEGADVRGSSLIGDGLASCVYSFSNLDDDRTRIIIFSTDNDLAGTPLVTLEDAAKISKSKKIKVFGIGTELMKTNDRNEFKSAIEATGGKFYEESTSTVKGIVSDIEATSKSLLKGNLETKMVDIPEVPFIILTLSVIGLIFAKKVIG